MSVSGTTGATKTAGAALDDEADGPDVKIVPGSLFTRVLSGSSVDSPAALCPPPGVCTIVSLHSCLDALSGNLRVCFRLLIQPRCCAAWTTLRVAELPEFNVLPEIRPSRWPSEITRKRVRKFTFHHNWIRAHHRRDLVRVWNARHRGPRRTSDFVQQRLVATLLHGASFDASGSHNAKVRPDVEIRATIHDA